MMDETGKFVFRCNCCKKIKFINQKIEYVDQCKKCTRILSLEITIDNMYMSYYLRSHPTLLKAKIEKVEKAIKQIEKESDQDENRN